MKKTGNKPHTLRTRLLTLITFIMGTLLLLQVLTGILWFQSRFQETTNSEFDIAVAIGLTFKSVVRDISRTAYVAGLTYERLEPYFTSSHAKDYYRMVNEIYPVVQDFGIADSNGKILTGSNNRLIGIDVSNRNYFHQLIQGDSVVVSNILLDMKPDSIAGFVIAHGFYKKSGALNFAVIANVHAEKLGEISIPFHRQKQEYYALFDKNGTLVYTNEELDTLTDSLRVHWKDTDKLLRKAIKGQASKGFFDVPIDFSASRVGARVPIYDLNWISGASMSQQSFFHPLLTSSAIYILMLILLSSVTLLISNRNIRIIIESLKSVQKHFKIIAQGEFATMPASSNFNEFNDLINDANSMAQQLKIREERLHMLAAVVENSNDFILLTSPDMVPFYINAAGSQIIGIDRETVNKTRIKDYFSTEDQKLFEEIVIPAMRQNFHWSGRVNLKHFITEELIPTIWNAFSIKDESGKITAWATTSPDLTELEKTTNALKESEQRFRGAIEGMLDAFVIMVPIYNKTGNLVDYTFEYANRVALELAEMDWEQYVGHRINELFPPEAQKDVLAIYERVLKTGKPAIIDAYLLDAPLGAYKQGIYLDIRASRLDGKIALAWRDVTYRVKAEEALRKSEERFRSLANSMPQLVWTANPDGKFDYYNDRYRDFAGIATNESNNLSSSLVIYKDDCQLTADSWNNAIRMGISYQIEHRIQHSDGTWHWYLSRAIPVRNENNTIVKWYGTTTNIDSTMNAQLALSESESRLKTLNKDLESIVNRRTEQVRALSKALIYAEQRERQRFSYIMHENLQQLILGSKILLNQHIREHKAVSSVDFDDVLESVKLLEKALQTTNALSVELNPPVLRSQGLDTALQWLVNHMKQNYGLTVDLSVAGPINQIKNETQLMLTQMVRELLNNVVQHSNVHFATIETDYKEKNIQITVCDKGRGFDPQSVINKKISGTHLGLFSIRERLKLFGGDLIIESTPGKGTCCTISLQGQIY